METIHRGGECLLSLERERGVILSNHKTLVRNSQSNDIYGLFHSSLSRKTLANRED